MKAVHDSSVCRLCRDPDELRLMTFAKVRMNHQELGQVLSHLDDTKHWGLNTLDVTFDSNSLEFLVSFKMNI